MDLAEKLTGRDREILRALAHRQLEAANSPKNRSRVEAWKKHNALCGERPMIHVELGTFEQEIIPQRLRCETESGRQLERALWSSFINLTEFDDDRVVPDYFGVNVRTWFNPFGHVVTQHNAVNENGEKSLGHQFDYWISDLEEDWDKLKPSDFGADLAGTKAYKVLAESAFGDILPVRLDGAALYAVPTQQVVHLMGMEQMCFALYDCPELFLEMMDRLAEDYLAFFGYLEKNGLLYPTTTFQPVGQGTVAFTDELKKEMPLKTTDVWGFLDSQETVSISPEMFHDFVFPCYKKIAQCYGLLSYGCCEPVHPVWESIKTLPNLRKVSVSPWCDQAFMAEQLRGSKTIFHRKPSPNYLGMGTALDEDAFRAHISETIRLARGCTLEITQRDVYTINNDIHKVRRYVEIIREEIEAHWTI